MPDSKTVFLHGWGLHGGIWSETRASCCGEAPDLPGYDGMPLVAPYHAETLADIVAGKLSEAVSLVGWSMGGMVALALAARHPEKVARLVLVGTSPVFMNREGWGHGLDETVLSDFAQELQRDYRATLMRFLSLQARGGDSARAVVTRLRDSLATRDEPTQALLAAGLGLLREVDLRGVAARVTCPTLVIHGAYDTLCPVAAGEWLATHIPQARLVRHERAAHAPFISHPDWFVATLKVFLHGH